MVDPDDSDYQLLRCSAITLAMLSYLLFQTSSDILIPIICGLRVMKNAMMLVLAKALIGLDRARADDSMLTTGSPFIL